MKAVIDIGKANYYCYKTDKNKNENKSEQQQR